MTWTTDTILHVFLAMRQKLIQRNAPLRSPHKAEKATTDNKHYMRGEAFFSRGGPSSFYGGIYKKDIGGGYNILRVYGVQLQRTTAEQSISFSDMSAHLFPKHLFSNQDMPYTIQ